MKKVLEGALLSIAHRILQMKDKEDVNTLYKEAKEVYEKLAVLKFYNDNKASLEGLISEEVLEKQLEIVTANSAQEQWDDLPSIIVDREQMPTDLIQDEDDMKSILVNYEEDLLEDTKGTLRAEEESLDDMKSILVNYEEELLEDTKGTLLTEEESLDDMKSILIDNREELLEDTKGTLHTEEDLLDKMKSVLIDNREELLEDTKGTLHTEEDLLDNMKSVLIDNREELLEDTKGVLLTEKEPYSESFDIKPDAVKIETIIENMDFEKQRLAYENQFIETPFVDSIEEEESDDILHSYLDQHEAMLQQKAVLVNEEDVIVDKELQEAIIHPESAGLDQGQVRIEDSFLGFDFGDVDFVRVEDAINEASVMDDTDFVPLVEKEDTLPTQSLFEFEPISSSAVQKKSINDIYNSTISIGLNDRIGFEKHLFNGSSEDLNRVLSQLNTVNSWGEAVAFIEDLVKPDYNNWEGKEEYVERFMELAQKRFV